MTNKFEIITNPEALNSQPFDTVIRAANGRIYTRDKTFSGAFFWYLGNGSISRTPPLPATVIPNPWKTTKAEATKHENDKETS